MVMDARGCNLGEFGFAFLGLFEVAIHKTCCWALHLLLIGSDGILLLCETARGCPLLRLLLLFFSGFLLVCWLFFKGFAQDSSSLSLLSSSGGPSVSPLLSAISFFLVLSFFLCVWQNSPDSLGLFLRVQLFFTSFLNFLNFAEQILK